MIFAAQDAAGDVDVFAPGFRCLGKRFFHVVLAAHTGELDQHGQVHASNDFDVSRLHDRYRHVGRCSAEHVGENDDPETVIGAHHGFEDVLPTLIHIVFGTDRNGFDQFLRTDDMLDRMPELFSQLAMGDKHHSDHLKNAPKASSVC